MYLCMSTDVIQTEKPGKEIHEESLEIPGLGWGKNAKKKTHTTQTKQKNQRKQIVLP